MKVVQWNTHHGGKRTDGTLDIIGFGHALQKLNPDVVCLNEVEQFDGYGNADQVGIWAEALGLDWHGWFANLSGVVDGHGQGNAILARTADVEATSLTVKTLYDSRVALAIRVKGVTIVSAHLDDREPKNRLVEIVQLFGWNSFAMPSKVIICADWNAVPEAIEMAPLRVFLKDAWVSAATRTSFNGTGNTRGHRIDAIFSRGLPTVSCDVPDTSVNGVFPSDHHPVIAVYP